MSRVMYYLYILRCSDDTLYTGITTDIIRRVGEHNGTQKGAKYTRARRPVTLVYNEVYPDRSSASKREYYIKHKMSRKDKSDLINRSQ
jgi:putative endonuclease